MSFREYLYKAVRSYFILVTLITAAIVMIGQSVDPDARFGYKEMLNPLLYAAVGIIPNFIMISRKEPSAAQYMIRKAIQLIVVEAEVLALCLASSMIENGNIIFIEISVFVVFAAANAIGIASDIIAARNMTDDLARFQKSAEPEK